MTSNPVVMATRVKETRAQTLMFDALEPDGSNFLEWNNDMITYLCAEELDGTLDAEAVNELPLPPKVAGFAHHTSTHRRLTTQTIHTS